MAWRNCTQYSLENCGSEKPCQFNGSVNYTCSGRSFSVEGENTMPAKKTKKKPPAKKIKDPIGRPITIQEGSPEAVLKGGLPAIALVDRVQDLLVDISKITDELEDRQERCAEVKEQLRDTKFNNDKLSVEFGWNEGPETPSVRIGVFADRGFIYTETTLGELNEMLQWCKEQMGNFNERPSEEL